MTASVHAARFRGFEKIMEANGWDGFLLAYTDRFLNEFIPLSERRLEWLTGFSGSAGLALLHRGGKHTLFVDGRYTLQAAQEVDPACCQVLPWTDAFLLTAAGSCLGTGAHVGVDPWCHSVATLKRYQHLLEPLEIVWDTVEGPHPLDALWTEQPQAPAHLFQAHAEAYSGKSSQMKRRAIVEAHPEVGAWLLASNTSLAWLLNARGEDLPCTPVNRCYGILHADTSVDLFVTQQTQVSDSLQASLQPCRVHVFQDLGVCIASLASQKVAYDPATTPFGLVKWVEMHAPTAKPVELTDPCQLPMACKNTVELEQIRQAHVWDGVAWVRWLHWLKTHPALEQETELSATEKLEFFRGSQHHYAGPSFETIAGHGPHGAVIHYHPTPETNRSLTPGHLFLVDAGGQYRNGGTTDTTRTLALGSPTPAQREFYTRVLKGHIALARLHFPTTATGAQLDGVARQSLWERGADYNHGTGHGVGSFLAVHEGPQGVSSRSVTSLLPGMVLSNEPGYYEEGQYGIRLENVILTKLSVLPQQLCFETLTLVPFEADLVDRELLTPQECAWLADYHRLVLQRLASELSQPLQTWLEHYVAPFLSRRESST